MLYQNGSNMISEFQCMDDAGCVPVVDLLMINCGILPFEDDYDDDDDCDDDDNNDNG